MTKIVTKSFTETLLKIVVILVGLYLFTELIEGLIGYDGITMLQAAVVDALLAGTVPGFLLVGDRRARRGDGCPRCTLGPRSDLTWGHLPVLCHVLPVLRGRGSCSTVERF